MKYSKNFVEEICEELKKVPNIKYVSKKFGINRSTLYRWRIRHHFFEQSLVDALYIGRESINDSAESVIINGVQNGDIKCAKYWLGHNHERYISVERVPYLAHLENIDRQFLRKPAPKDAVFDHMFKYQYLLEDHAGINKSKKTITSLVEFICREDDDLIEIYYAAYREFKSRRDTAIDKTLKANDNQRRDS